MLSRKLTLLICSELPYFFKQVHIFPRGGVELEDNSFNPEQISRMMNMIKMVQMLNNENKSNEDDIKTVNDKNDTVVEELLSIPMAVVWKMRFIHSVTKVWVK